MDKLELLQKLLTQSVEDIDSIEVKNDFIIGLRMGYIQCIGVISEIRLVD